MCNCFLTNVNTVPFRTSHGCITDFQFIKNVDIGLRLKFVRNLRMQFKRPTTECINMSTRQILVIW